MNNVIILSGRIQTFFEAQDLRDMGEASGGLAEFSGGEERYEVRFIDEGKRRTFVWQRADLLMDYLAVVCMYRGYRDMMRQKKGCEQRKSR
jgi:hypothetical protein